MILGAVFAWGWLPSLQEAPRATTRICELTTLPSKTLEKLAQGRVYATETGHEVLTFQGNLIAAWDLFGTLLNGGYARRRRGQAVTQGVELDGVNGHSTAIGS
jgi:hypothetical protein